MFGRRVAGHSHHSEHPLRRRVLLTILGAALLAALFLLIAPRNANGNFVYWTNGENSGTSIGRAKINGTGANNNFIAGLAQPSAVAVDSKFIYWGESDRIGRANLDGSGANPNFITTGVVGPFGLAVTATSGIYWVNGDDDTVGHASIDGSNPVGNFFDTGSGDACGLATDQSFLYWLNSVPPFTIGRAALSGADPNSNFISLSSAGCGVAADASFLYWATGNNTIGRAPVGGGTPNEAFIPAAGPTSACGVAVNSQYVFWGGLTGTSGPNFVGRANINGNAANPALIAGVGQACALAAAPSNKVTVNSVKKKKKKGTATIDAKVPGPGQVTLNQTSAPSDVNAVAAGVKQVALTITQASSFKLAVKPTGKTAKKLNKQVKKQLRKKRKAKAKASVTVFINFVPAGVAGVPNTERLKVTLIKQRSKKK